MDNGLFVFVTAIIIGLFSLSALFLPRRRIAVENEQVSLHTEYCAVTGYVGIFAFGSPFSFFSKRISFYENFFVVAGITAKIYAYSDIKSASYKHNWLSKSVALNFCNGQSLVLNPRNINKVKSLIEPRIRKK